MKLLNNKELFWSPVVANNAMNRERGLIGPNNYCQELGIDCISFLEERALLSHDAAKWIDLCCGKGHALAHAHHHFQKKTMQSIEFEGVDLIGDFCEAAQEYPKLSWEIKSLEEWAPTQKYDLITCVHGLHYLGDKLGIIEKCIAHLKEDGLFLANIDFENIKKQDRSSLKKALVKSCNSQGLQYDSKNRLLKCKGRKDVKFGFHYLGANDQAGPNYTGQPVVDSYYKEV